MPTESDRAGEQQRDTDGEKNQTEDQQGEHGRSEQVDVDPGPHVHADPCGCVGVHHHHGPCAVAQIPFHLLGAGPLRRCDPEVLRVRSSRGVAPGNVTVGDLERLEPQIGHDGVGDP
ncbi:hypothetical protein [Rhodococcus pyridinivorans]